MKWTPRKEVRHLASFGGFYAVRGDAVWELYRGAGVYIAQRRTLREVKRLAEKLYARP